MPINMIRSGSLGARFIIWFVRLFLVALEREANASTRPKFSYSPVSENNSNRTNLFDQRLCLSAINGERIRFAREFVLIDSLFWDSLCSGARYFEVLEFPTDRVLF